MTTGIQRGCEQPSTEAWLQVSKKSLLVDGGLKEPVRSEALATPGT